MIGPAEIQAVIRTILQETFPGEPIYEDLTPRNFARPSNLVQLDGISSEQAGRNLVTLMFRFKITTFSEVDEIRSSHLAVLDARSMVIAAAFAGGGCIKVKDRAPTIAACTADTTSYDYAEISLGISLTYDRSEFTPAEACSIMQDLALRTKTKEDTEA